MQSFEFKGLTIDVKEFIDFIEDVKNYSSDRFKAVRSRHTYDNPGYVVYACLDDAVFVDLVDLTHFKAFSYWNDLHDHGRSPYDLDQYKNACYRFEKNCKRIESLDNPVFFDAMLTLYYKSCHHEENIED